MVNGSVGCCIKKTNPEIPIAKATGIPSIRKIANKKNTSNIVVPP
jgi:hypothetical protein